MTPPFSTQTRLLVVAPHPDDETLATGVLIQQVLAAGGAVHLLLLTDGDNNPWPQRWLERRVRVGRGDRRRWAERRRSELRQAMAALGLPASALTALGWADQGLTARVQTALTASMTCLGEVVRSFGPNLVAMPALDDRHPDHAAAHVLMRLALAAGDARPECLLYRVHGSSEGDRHGAGVSWPAAPAMQVRKLAALACHVSQLALSHTRMHRLAARAERFEWLYPTVARTALPWHPPRISRPWLTLTLAGMDGGSVSTWSQAPWRHGGAGGLQLSPAAQGSPRFVKLQSRLPTPWIFDHWGWCEWAG